MKKFLFLLLSVFVWADAMAQEQCTPLEMEVKAEAGDTEAQSKYGLRLLQQGKTEEGLLWLKKAAEQGYSEAQYNIGVYYYNNKDHVQALSWWEKAAIQNDVDAQKRLGLHYLNNNNYEKAFPWLEKAANAGDSDAQCGLGSYYNFYKKMINKQNIGIQKVPTRTMCKHKIS